MMSKALLTNVFREVVAYLLKSALLHKFHYFLFFLRKGKTTSTRDNYFYTYHWTFFYVTAPCAIDLGVLFTPAYLTQTYFERLVGLK